MQRHARHSIPLLFVFFSARRRRLFFTAGKYPSNISRESSMKFPPILLFLLPFLLLSTSSSSSVTVPISIFPSRRLFSNPWQSINNIASATLTRAHHLKRRSKSNADFIKKAALSPRSYGGYSVSLSFGTPPQLLPLVFDTGSSLVWFPCTARYICSNCSFSNVNHARIPKFMPKASSSAKTVGCRSPKCAWVFGPNVSSRCKNCRPMSRNCTDSCPSYAVQYGSGATAGILLSETLDFPGKKVPDFLVGCSLSSIRQPAGIAGFGRGPESLPSQMRLRKFSYCLISRRFDDSPRTGSLILDSGSKSGHSKTKGLIYSPFGKNPSHSNPAFREYYYLSLRKIVIDKKAVKIPYKYLKPDSEGNGGSIIDSGSTFTFLEKQVFEAVAGELEKKLIKYPRAPEVEAEAGLQPCFNFTGDKTVDVPAIVFVFKGGAKLALPPENYFIGVSSADRVLCLAMMADDGGGGGPAIIVGAFQQQNVYVEYDLANERIGFRKQKCG